jgi:hypothetical protein
LARKGNLTRRKTPLDTELRFWHTPSPQAYLAVGGGGRTRGGEERQRQRRHASTRSRWHSPFRGRRGVGRHARPSAGFIGLGGEPCAFADGGVWERP